MYSKLGLNLGDVFSLKIPMTDKISSEYDSKFLIPAKSYFEKQEKNQCGGYSTAYVLRCLNEEATGKEIYTQFKHTFKNGYVLPQSLIQTFKKYGYKAKIRKGNIETLKARASAGVPVIVIIGDGMKWQHYVSVVGYDEGNILLYDSNYDTNNASGYNRVLSNSEFNKLWENGIPFFEKSYFVIYDK